MRSPLPLPDRGCQRRLVKLHAQGLTLWLVEPERLFDQTEGMSALHSQVAAQGGAVLASSQFTPTTGWLPSPAA